MNNLVKQSLQDNLQDILKNLPDEFHSDLKKSIESASPATRLNNDDAKDLATQLMQENPLIDDLECVPMLDSDSMTNQAIGQPSDAELERQKQQSLVEIQDSLATN